MTPCTCPTYQGVRIHFDCCPALRAHRQAVEDWIRKHTSAAGITDLAEVKRRCMLHQHHGRIDLFIDDKQVASMDDWKDQPDPPYVDK